MAQTHGQPNPKECILLMQTVAKPCRHFVLMQPLRIEISLEKKTGGPMTMAGKVFRIISYF